MSDCTVTYVTCASSEEALRIAEVLVSEKLAACVNIVPGVTSVYFWEGKLCRDGEQLLIVKSTREVLERLTKRVKELHSYAVPEVVSLPVVGGSAEYLQWVEGSVR